MAFQFTMHNVLVGKSKGRKPHSKIYIQKHPKVIKKKIAGWPQ